MQNLIVGIIIISIIAYIVFVRRTKKLYNAIDMLLSENSDSITLSQSLGQIRSTIQAQFNNVISTDKTILFEHKFNSFIVVAINNKEVLISLAPSEKEVQNYEKLENKKNNTETIEEILYNLNSKLPIQINQKIYIEQVFGDKDYVWIIFKAPERNTVEKDEETRDFLITIMADTLFVKNIHNFGAEISIQIIAENQQNIATSGIENISEEDNSYFINNKQKIINRLNKAELDYSDILHIHTNYENDYSIGFEMKSEENFSLPFENENDLKIANEMVIFKLNFSSAIYELKMSNYTDRIELNENLKDFQKTTFEELLNSYNLDQAEINAAYEWQENNNNKDREDKVIDFTECSLRFLTSGDEEISAVLIMQSEKTIKNEEIKKQKLKQEIDEIPF